jgi:hypothetical protein
MYAWVTVVPLRLPMFINLTTPYSECLLFIQNKSKVRGNTTWMDMETARRVRYLPCIVKQEHRSFSTYGTLR